MCSICVLVYRSTCSTCCTHSVDGYLHIRNPAYSIQDCTTIESSLEECTFSLSHVPLGRKCTLRVVCSTCFTEECALYVLSLCFNQYKSAHLSKLVWGVRNIFTSCAPSRKYTLHTVCATYATEECTLYALSLCLLAEMHFSGRRPGAPPTTRCANHHAS